MSTCDLAGCTVCQAAEPPTDDVFLSLNLSGLPSVGQVLLVSSIAMVATPVAIAIAVVRRLRR